MCVSLKKRSNLFCVMALSPFSQCCHVRKAAPTRSAACVWVNPASMRDCLICNGVGLDIFQDSKSLHISIIMVAFLYASSKFLLKNIYLYPFNFLS